MKRHIPIDTGQLSIVCFVILIAVVSVSCSPIFAARSTPEKLELINGELDPCQLINVAEVESVISAKSFPKKTFGESAWWCAYYPISDDGGAFFITTVYTDATIKRANQFFHRKSNSTELDSAADVYDGQKMQSQRLVQEISDYKYKMEEIEDLGDQAFSTDLGLFTINILNNGIYYAFSASSDHGVSKEALMKLVQIALQRMP